jgi:hypothetical protein
MQAVELELSRKQNELLRDLVLVLATDGLNSLNGERRAALMESYSQAQVSAPQ